MKKKEFTAIGLMTGTSMDGVDLSLVKSDGFYQITGILDTYIEFDKELREKLIDLRSKIFQLKDLLQYSREIDELDNEITLFHNKIITETIKDTKENVDLIGFHGQTIFHNPEKKISKQIGSGNLLSRLTKKIVINNFRQNDLENGGQGAPLTPIYHKSLIKIISKKNKIKYPIGIINIGGITNMTQVFNDEESTNKNLSAFDIGPGNCLIDEWIRKNSEFKYDEKGNIARKGKINVSIINQARENFNIKSYEKSLDTKDFDLSFVRGLSFEDGCATVTDFTAYLISQGIKFANNFKDRDTKFYLISGGGRKNDFLIELINKYLSNTKIELANIDSYGYDGDFIESQAFGYLAIRSKLNLPISFPQTTRCKTPTTGGVINKNF